MNTFGKRVRAAREALNWTQDDLRSSCGLSGGFLSDIENDKRNPSAVNILRLSDALKVSVEWLLRGHKPKKIKCPLCGKGTIQL